MEIVAPETPRGDQVAPTDKSDKPDKPEESKQGFGKVYVAVDTEGLGADLVRFPTVAVAFAAVDASGRKLYTWQGYMPYNVCKDTIEPRCFDEFWNNPAKCDPKALPALQKSCAESKYASRDDFWQAVSTVIDEIYELFGPGNVTWVGDCLDYDYGRIDCELMCRSIRPMGLRYDTKTKKRHYIEDCGSGRELLKSVNPDKYATYKRAVEATGLKHTHDCLDDAILIATKHALYQKTVADYVAELMN